jgi:hypothetical protein
MLRTRDVSFRRIATDACNRRANHRWVLCDVAPLLSIAGLWAHRSLRQIGEGSRNAAVWDPSRLCTVAIWFMNGLTAASSAGAGTITTDWTIQGTNADRGEAPSFVIPPPPAPAVYLEPEGAARFGCLGGLG